MHLIIKKETFTRRSDQKKFYIREIIGDFWDSDEEPDPESDKKPHP